MSLLRQNFGINHLTAALAVEELVRNGVRKFVVSPGNQSTALAVALAKHSGVETFVHYDERGAAFFALGLAKASESPAALVCTSGTALANYYPAVLEASYSQTPLLVLSADRPEELQQTGANQTFEQVHLFKQFVRWEHNISADTDLNLASILTAVDFAVAKSQGSNAGPIHLNFRFRKPFLGDAFIPANSEKLVSWEESSRPFTTYASTISVPAETDIRSIAALLQKAESGLLVLGDLGPAQDLQAVAALAETLGWPVYAGVSSNFRFSKRLGKSSEQLACNSAIYLEDPEVCTWFKPDCILQLGLELPKPGNAVVRWIETCGAERILVSSIDQRQDSGHSVARRVQCDPSWFALEIEKHLKASTSKLSQVFSTAERGAQEVLAKNLEAGALTEQTVVQQVFGTLAQEQNVFIANSLPIRLAEAFVGRNTSDSKVFSNRGLSGIDGTLATAIGVAQSAGGVMTLLCGDLALLHDLNSLALLRSLEFPFRILVLNNDGGGIFSLVPLMGVSEDQREKFFGTPHGVVFAEAAAMFGLDYHCPGSLRECAAILSSTPKVGKPELIEVKTVRAETRQELLRLRVEVADEIKKSIAN